MIGVFGDKLAERLDGGVLLTFCPLPVGEKDHGAAGGLGIGVFRDDGLECSEISSLVQGGTGGFLAAFLDSAINDKRGGPDGNEDGKNDEILLIAIEKLLEGIRALGDFCEWHWGFWGICGHDVEGAILRRPDQSGDCAEINAEVWNGIDFHQLLISAGVFHGHSEEGSIGCPGMSKRLYVVAGELSGDAHGAGLLRSLKSQVAAVEIHGVGGPEMAAVAGPGLKDWVEDAAVMGLWEVLKRYGWFKERFEEMLGDLKEFRPDVLLLIDYPGFNLRFAEAVKAACPETRIVYYISPQVWAWKKGRIPKIVRLVDEMLCLFPFEREIFEKAGLKTTFAGHPLVDELEEKRLPDVIRDENLVGLFPGSREREVARLFPMMIESAKKLKAWRSDLKFEVPAASAKLADQIRNLLAQAGAGDLVSVNLGESHSLMQRACCAVIASGTATLEAAFYGLPYCLVYRVAPLTYAVAKVVVTIRFIGIVNILAGKEVVEELIQSRAEPDAVSRSLRAFLESPEKRSALQARLAETTGKLGEAGAHERAAEVVAGWLLGKPAV